MTLLIRICRHCDKVIIKHNDNGVKEKRSIQAYKDRNMLCECDK